MTGEGVVDALERGPAVVVEAVGLGDDGGGEGAERRAYGGERGLGHRGLSTTMDGQTPGLFIPT